MTQITHKIMTGFKCLKNDFVKPNLLYNKRLDEDTLLPFSVWDKISDIFSLWEGIHDTCSCSKPGLRERRIENLIKAREELTNQKDAIRTCKAASYFTETVNCDTGKIEKVPCPLYSKKLNLKSYIKNNITIQNILNSQAKKDKMVSCVITGGFLAALTLVGIVSGSMTIIPVIALSCTGVAAPVMYCVLLELVVMGEASFLLSVFLARLLHNYLASREIPSYKKESRDDLFPNYDRIPDVMSKISGNLKSDINKINKKINSLEKS